MALSPDDIVNYEFKQSLRGYAVNEVDELLDRLADQVERNERDIDELRQRLRETEARLAAALETESTLKRTLVTAQQAAERSLDDARRQADELRTAAEREVTEQLERARTEAQELITQAQKTAEAELADAREERAATEQRITHLQEIEQQHRQALKQHLKTQLDALKSLDELSARAGEQSAGMARPDPAGDAGAEARGELTVRVRDVDRAEESAAGDHDETDVPSWERAGVGDDQAAAQDDRAATEGHDREATADQDGDAADVPTWEGGENEPGDPPAADGEGQQEGPADDPSWVSPSWPRPADEPVEGRDPFGQTSPTPPWPDRSTAGRDDGYR